MAYNYLGLVNDVLGRVNEVQLTPSTFTNTSGFNSVAKEAVNSSIRLINQDQFFWPFNYIEREETLVAGTNRYPYPDNVKKISYDNFRIKRNSTFNNETQHLRYKDYEEYVQKLVDDENQTGTGVRDLPRFVFRGPGNEFILWPIPDEAYELVYEYYMLPVDLELYSDVPSIPEAFRHIIVDGAMYYTYTFRSDYENADRMYQKYLEGIGNMKGIYINRYEYVRDTRVHRNPIGLSETLKVN